MGVDVFKSVMSKGDIEAQERARRLAAIRERIHKIKSQRAFAARLGISQGRYNHYEKGFPLPTDQARKIKEITPGIDLDYIFEGETGGLSVEALRKLTEEND